MHKRYEAKHYNGKVKMNSASRMIISVILLILLALNNISGILSYFTSNATIINNFSIAQTYTVHFDANTGTGLMNDQTMTMGVSSNLTSNSFTKTGYTFNGWNTAANGSGNNYNDGELVSNLTNTAGSTVILYAQWELATYNITYNLDGGTVATSNPTTYNMQTSAITLNNPTKDGYTFKGWSGTDLTGDTNTTVTIQQGSTGDRTYTANYIPNTYYIRFNSNGGTGTMNNQQMTYGTAATLTPNDFQKDEYSFTEWNTEPDGLGTSYEDEESVNNLTTINGGYVDLYAQWEDELYVAQIGNQKYTTLSAAFAAVHTNGEQTTIKLLKNTSISSKITIASTKNIILNLQRHTITNTASNTSSASTFENDGTLEVRNGTLTSGAKAGVINNNATGNVKIDNVIITATGSRQAVYNLGGTMEITGDSQLSATTTERATVQNAKPNNGTAGTIIISGGTITSANYSAVENIDTGTIQITGGTIISETGKGVDNKGTLIIGTDDAEVHTDSPVIQGYTNGVTTTTAGTLEFYDGIVKGKTSAFNDENYIDTIDSNSTLDHSTEQINGDTYRTAFLDAPAKVTFDARGGTPEFEYKHLEPGDPVGTLPTATKARCTLDGWYTAAEGGTQVTTTTTVNGHTTYYAHWTQTEALVTFLAPGGNPEEQTRTVNVGSQVGSLPTATKTNNEFVGWFTTEDNTGTQISASTQITADVTYYAHWNPLKYIVTFDANLGSVTEAEREVTPGTALTALPVPTRPNYYFTGWFTDPNNGTQVREGDVITGDVDLYAHWISSAVASIGAINYASLQDAINDVPRDNTQTTITLLNNTLESTDIFANQNIILDLNGYTLSNNGSKMTNTEKRPSAIENYGTLLVTNGTVTSSSTQSSINNDGGTLTIHNATVTQTGSGEKQAVYNYARGTIIISGSTVISANNAGEWDHHLRGAVQNAGGTLIITGATITSNTGPGIVNQQSSTLILGESGGGIDATSPSVQAYTDGVFNYNTGTFNFYDGIVKGINSSINGTVANTESGSTRVDDTEVIGGDTYYVTYYQ